MMTTLELSERDAYAYRHNPLAARWSVNVPGQIHVADAQDAAASSRCAACGDVQGTVIRVATATLTYHCAGCRAEWTVLRNRRPAVG